MDPYIGKVLDNRYEILERIGTGGMAVVYKAKCHRLNRLVAVKILKSDLAQDADFRRRFNAESQAVAQLSHANIVSIYDVSRDGDIQYIVMELVDGITLKQYMERRGQLNWREALHFITQIMRGISHAHSRGIIHRDIKPQNIMVLRDGSVKVADFGIACLENTAQTMTQEALGSVHYISPEQARGDRIDVRSDIYSAGVVLYEMLAGRLPFEGGSAVSVAIQHLSSIPLAPREINPDIPEQLEQICMKAMASDINRRYCSADEMIADLEAFREDPGVDLNIDISDLHPEENDEPTQFIRDEDTVRQVVAKNRYNSEREYPEEKPEHRGKKKMQKQTKVTIGLVIAVVLAIFLVFQSIMGSFHAKPSNQSEVPPICGYTVKEVEGWETIQGIFDIEVESESIPSDEYPAGTIARQSPEAGEIRKGDNRVIQVWISSGEAQATMPDVTVSDTVSSAKAKMRKLIKEFDLTLDYSEEYDEFSDEVNKGYIISTDPAAGEPLKKGSVIHIVVSKGPEEVKVTVPSFIGRNIDEVLKELKDTWKLTCNEGNIQRVESSEKAGAILWQSLDKNAEVDAWSTIQFKVSSGPAPEEEPEEEEEEVKVYTKQETVNLPQDGRDVVRVEVYVGDEDAPQYSEPLHCSDGVAYVTLKGSGSQKIKVYFDGVLDQGQSRTVNFEEGQ